MSRLYRCLVYMVWYLSLWRVVTALTPRQRGVPVHYRLRKYPSILHLTYQMNAMKRRSRQTWRPWHALPRPEEVEWNAINNRCVGDNIAFAVYAGQALKGVSDVDDVQILAYGWQGNNDAYRCQSVALFKQNDAWWYMGTWHHGKCVGPFPTIRRAVTYAVDESSPGQKPLWHWTMTASAPWKRLAWEP